MQHFQEGAARPLTHIFRIATAEMVLFAERVFGILVPEKRPRLIHRMKRVDHHEDFAKRQSGLDASFAECLRQRGLVSNPKQASLGQPRGDLFAIMAIHDPIIAASSAGKKTNCAAGLVNLASAMNSGFGLIAVIAGAGEIKVPSTLESSVSAAANTGLPVDHFIRVSRGLCGSQCRGWRRLLLCGGNPAPARKTVENLT